MKTVTGSRMILAQTRRGSVPVRVDDRVDVPVDAVMMFEGVDGAWMAARVAAMAITGDSGRVPGPHDDGGPPHDPSGRGTAAEAPNPGEGERRIDDGEPTAYEAMRIVAMLFPNPAGEMRLGDVVASDDIVQPEGHDWGALGLPLGSETRLSFASPVDDDVGAALASAGHRLTIESASHDVMPGDDILVAGSTCLVVAIDRRNDRMTLRATDGEEREVVFQRTMQEAG